MTKTIEEAAKEYANNAYYPAPDYGWYESDDEQMKECLADTFKAGANYVCGLPLASRMTAEEKESVRKMYKELSECIETRTADVEYLKGKRCQLAIIFGADFFKEGE